MAADLTESAQITRFDGFHPEVAIARELFAGGHLQEAVRKAAERFINRVAQEAEREDLHGASLMNHAFSAEQPVLVFSESRLTPTEQSLHNGFRFLAVGLTEAIRNVYTHEDKVDVDEIEALEWLGFISAMHRRLDRAEQMADSLDSVTHSEGDRETV